MAVLITFTSNTTAKASEVNSNFTAVNAQINPEHNTAGKHTVINPTATKQTLVTVDDAATITFDLDTGGIFQVTMTDNRTLAISNEDAGQVFVLRLIQDGNGSRVPTFFSTIKWPGGVAPVLTTTADKTDVFGFITTSAGNYDGFIVGQNL